MTDDPRTICAAFDAGVRWFFLSGDLHWPLYEAVRRGLAMLFERSPSIRDEVVIAVASYVTQPEFVTSPFEEVLAACPGLKRVDVAIAGGAYGHEIGRRLDVYRERVAPNIPGVRAIAATFHDRRAAVSRRRALDARFVRYNPVHRGAVEDVFQRFANFVRQGPPDLKRADALALLDLLRGYSEKGTFPLVEPSFRFERTVFFDALLRGEMP